MEDDLQARLGSLVAVDSEAGLNGTLTRSIRSLPNDSSPAVRPARAHEALMENGEEEEPPFASQGSDSTLGSTMEGEYDVHTELGRRPSEIGIAFASSSVQMVQLASARNNIPEPPALPSPVLQAAIPPVVAQHKSVLALKPPSVDVQAESPFVERRDSPRKIVQMQQRVEEGRGSTLDGAELDIPLLTSTPLQPLQRYVLSKNMCPINGSAGLALCVISLNLSSPIRTVFKFCSTPSVFETCSLEAIVTILEFCG